MAVYSIEGVANRIKIEALDRKEVVQESIFAEVYRKADRLFFEIVKEMQQISDDDKMWSGQIANVISFLGGRGRGKTSAMLSFYSYLGKSKSNQREAWGEWEKLDGKIKFVEIPYIDAAALAQNEFIIEVILAKMWDGFDAVMEANPHSHDSQLEYLFRSVRTRFVNVQKSYTILREKETNEKREEEISAASALHELAASMNFKEEFEKLVQEYIEVLNYDPYNRHREAGSGYLVLAIDDIDMAGSQAQGILEQIRRFLSIPQIIIFLTADIERLKDVCEAFYQKVYPANKTPQKFVSEYLEKVLPTNQRVYMPELSRNQQEIPIDKNERKFEKLDLQSDREKEMILELMARKCGIYFDGIRRKRHFLQNDSLRSLVNYFNNIADMEDDEYIPWLKNDLQERIADRIRNDYQKEFVKSLLNKDYEDINSIILNYIKGNLKEKTVLGSTDNSMGQVLYACSIMENENVENTDFVNCILLLYGIILNQANNDMREKIIGNSVLGQWEYSVLSPSEVATDFIRTFYDNADIRFELTDDIKQQIGDKNPREVIEILLDRHKNEIMAWLYAMLFVDIKKMDAHAFEVKRVHVSEDGTRPNKDSDDGLHNASEYYVIKPKVRAEKSFFGCLHRDADSYIDFLKQFWGNTITAFCIQLYNDTKQEITDKEIKQIEKQYMHYIDDMKIGDDGTRLDLLQSVEIIYSIGKEIGKERLMDVSTGDNLYEKMVSRYNIISAELRRRDDYYMNEVGIVTTFEQNFLERIQTKIFLKPEVLTSEVKRDFIKYFAKIFEEAVPIKIKNI